MTMHLTREVLDAWADSRPPGVHYLVLAEGDTCPRRVAGAVIEGPAVVMLAVYRDEGWSARKLPVETPASISDPS